LFLVGLATFNGEYVMLGRYRDFIRRETGQRQRNLVLIVGQSFDVAGWVILIAAGMLRRVDEIEKAIEADG
jgi:hypothetical protein